MNPLEDQINDADEVILVVIGSDGIQHGWRVLGPVASYEITGYPGGSAHGQIRVSGEFHKVRREAGLHPLENPQVVGQLSLGLQALEAGDE